MVDLAKLFVLKFMDTAIGALKNIFMIKNMSFMSALSNTISYLFYILMMKKLLSSNDPISIVVTLSAVFIGQYVTQYLMDKSEKERVWKISITPSSIEEGQIIADKLREFNIPVRTYSCYTADMVKVLGIDVFSQSKAQSTMISGVLDEHEGTKFNIVDIRNRF